MTSRSLATQLQGLAARGDHRATIEFIKAGLADPASPFTQPHTRALGENALAQAQAALGLHLSALGSYQRAWHLVADEQGRLEAMVLEDWADQQMRTGQAAGARKNYARLLSRANPTRASKQRLTAAMMVACETVGATTEAGELRAQLGRGAANILAATRSRLAGVGPLRPTPRPVANAGQGLAIPANSRDILPGLRTRLHWSARALRTNHVPMTLIRAITVHHSAFAAPLAGSAGSQVRAIQADHQGKGWADIGYHFLIDAQGGVWEGRQLTSQGAHAGSNAPGLNVGNIGVCLLGNFETGPVPFAQETALLEVLDSLTTWFALPLAAVQPHSHFKPSTLCPGTRLKTIVARYRGEGRSILSRQ